MLTLIFVGDVANGFMVGFWSDDVVLRVFFSDADLEYVGGGVCFESGWVYAGVFVGGVS